MEKQNNALLMAKKTQLKDIIGIFESRFEDDPKGFERYLNAELLKLEQGLAECKTTKKASK